MTGSNADAAHLERLAESDASMLAVLSRRFGSRHGAAPQLAVRRVGLIGFGGHVVGSQTLICSGGVSGGSGVLAGAFIGVYERELV